MGNDYAKLRLQGSTADSAVKCMKEAGVMPSPQPEGSALTLPSLDTSVRVFENGQVSINEAFGSERYANSYMAPAGDKFAFPDDGSHQKLETIDTAHPAEVYTTEVLATGEVAEKMRQKAVACAYKAVGITP